MDSKTVALVTIESEILDCQEHCKKYSWQISEIDKADQSFTVLLVSPIDTEKYLLEINFENYPEWPLYLEFVEIDTGIKGSMKAYPKQSRKHGGFFHPKPCICHPSSRKAYKEYSGLHRDWDISAWKQNPQVTNLTNLLSILDAIYSRISIMEVYNGRMG